MSHKGCSSSTHLIFSIVPLQYLRNTQPGQELQESQPSQQRQVFQPSQLQQRQELSQRQQIQQRQELQELQPSQQRQEPQQLEPLSEGFRMLILNVEEYHEPGAIAGIHGLIVQVDPDIILFQEDVTTVPRPTRYRLVSSCDSHHGWADMLSNTIMVKDDDRSVTDSGHALFDMTGYQGIPRRCYASATYKALKIANIHLSGGRFEDPGYATNLHLRDKQVSQLVDYDIVAGDFNSSPQEEAFPDSHPVLQNITDPYQRILFKEYMQSGHKPLIDAGMSKIHIGEPTDPYGGKPDNVYYRSDKIRVKDISYLKAMGSGKGSSTFYTDHNGLIIDFIGS